MNTNTNKPKLKINIPSYNNNNSNIYDITRSNFRANNPKEPFTTKNAFLKISSKNKTQEMPPIIRQSPKASGRPSSISKNNNFLSHHISLDTPPMLKGNVISISNNNLQLKKPLITDKAPFNPSKTYYSNFKEEEKINNKYGGNNNLNITAYNKFEKPKNLDKTPATTKNKVISIMSLFASNLPLDIKHLNAHFSNFDHSKYSAKSLGVVKCYSANTHQGTVRDYNEDRVSIILNIVKPNSYNGSFWPKCSFFGIYDGHGGSGCAEFLRDNLHHFVVRDPNFPVNPKEALIQGFSAAENEFINNYALSINGYDIKDRSGSCAIVILAVDDVIYTANVGDSRAVLAKNYGKEIISLSRDHKPDDEDETKRIIEAGGKIYQ